METWNEGEIPVLVTRINCTLRNGNSGAGANVLECLKY